MPAGTEMLPLIVGQLGTAKEAEPDPDSADDDSVIVVELNDEPVKEAETVTEK